MAAISPSNSYSTSCSIDSSASPAEQLTLTSFNVIQEIAQGHGDVRIYLAENEGHGREVLKVSGSSLEREGKMMEMVTGRNIVRLIRRGEDERLGSWLTMEYCELGDLFRFIKKHGAFNERVARSVVSQLLGALQTCHNANVAHLDIKLENCYICLDGTLKLGDFGHAKVNESTFKNTKAGTLQYQAPEIRRKLAYDGCIADVFSLGVCVFILLLGRRPWKCATVEDRSFNMYLTRREAFWSRQSPAVSSAALSFLESLMTIDPSERPELDEVRSHVWLKGPKSLIEWTSLLC